MKMSENKVMQKITVIVDALTTDSEKFDIPCSFIQVIKGTVILVEKL